MTLLTRRLKEEAKAGKMLLFNKIVKTTDDVKDFLELKKQVSKFNKNNKSVMFLGPRFLAVK